MHRATALKSNEQEFVDVRERKANQTVLLED
jgi:hypothetical protein